MDQNELEKIWGLPSELSYRDRVEELEALFLKGELTGGDDRIEVENGGKDVLYPSTSKYNHYFSSGLYVREMFVAGGIFGFTGIHSLANPLFVMKGVMWCTTESGVQKLTAPMFVLTEPGTKRICWFPEDSVVVTVHPNPDGITDLSVMEKIITSANWSEHSEEEKEQDWKLIAHEKYHKKIENEINK